MAATLTSCSARGDVVRADGVVGVIGFLHGIDTTVCVWDPFVGSTRIQYAAVLMPPARLRTWQRWTFRSKGGAVSSVTYARTPLSPDQGARCPRSWVRLIVIERPLWSDWG